MWEPFIPEMEGLLYPRVHSTGKHGWLNFAEFDAYGRPTPQGGPDTMLSPRNGWPPPTGVP